jgi:hypothetical protein
MHGDMETQIHHIEQEAYYSVLWAFKAQFDAITWVSVFFLFLFYDVLNLATSDDTPII